MTAIYKLEIWFNPSIEIFNKVTKILNLSLNDKNLKNYTNDKQTIWSYEIIENNDDPYYDFINKFLDLLENNYEKLNELGIPNDNITFWYLYEYDQQCNMEFDPIRLKRLGDNGIGLCISCWDSGEIDYEEE